MTYSREKEFLRAAFHDGTLQIGSFKQLEHFCQIFTGELEAVLAAAFADSWLDEVERMKIVVAVDANMDVMQEYDRFCRQANNPT